MGWFSVVPTPSITNKEITTERLNNNIKTTETMFNFKVFTTAMLDTDLTDAEFRLLCLVLNTMSINETEEVKMHNGFIMEKMEKGERQVRNLVGGLVQKQYITRVVLGTENNHKANIYRLVESKRQKISVTSEEMSGEKNCRNVAAKNCPLNNINDINDKIINDNINDNINDRDISTFNDEVMTTPNDISNDNLNDSINDISMINQSNDRNINDINDRVRNQQDYFTGVKEWLNAKLDDYFKCKTPSTEKTLNDEVTRFIDSVTTDRMTPNQADTFAMLKRRFEGLKRQKVIYFNKWGYKKFNDTPSDRNINDNINDSANDTLTPKVAPRPLPQSSTASNEDFKATKRKEFEKWYIDFIENNSVNEDNTLIDNGTLCAAIDKRIDEVFGANWYANNDYKIVETASYIDNLFKRQANQYIAELNRIWQEDNENTQGTQVETIVNNSNEPTEKITTNDCNKYDDGIVYDENGEPIDLPF